MPSTTKLLDQIPILYVRGTYYEVGHTIGRQFKYLIDNILYNWSYLNEVLLPAYDQEQGKYIYDITLNLCNKKFPNYIIELQGMAAGANVPFHKLFLMHVESLMVPPDTMFKYFDKNESDGIGCTSIMCNTGGEILLGHTEDTSNEFANNVYIVNAEVLGKNGETLEKFSTLTYPGHLPGYTMGYNTHGLIYSLNTLYPLKPIPGKTPRTFLTRAILGASNMGDVMTILRDSGTGTSDGFSLNLTFVNNKEEFVWQNVEVGPPDMVQASELSIYTVPIGDSYAHCNRYLRLPVPQVGDPEFNSSSMRLHTIEKHEKPKDLDTLKHILSDRSDPNFPIFRTAHKPDNSMTLVVGIFDVKNRKWLIFTKPPAESSPVAVLPLEFAN